MDKWLPCHRQRTLFLAPLTRSASGSDNASELWTACPQPANKEYWGSRWFEYLISEWYSNNIGSKLFDFLISELGFKIVNLVSSTWQQVVLKCTIFSTFRDLRWIYFCFYVRNFFHFSKLDPNKLFFIFFLLFKIWSKQFVLRCII